MMRVLPWEFGTDLILLMPFGAGSLRKTERNRAAPSDSSLDRAAHWIWSGADWNPHPRPCNTRTMLIEVECGWVPSGAGSGLEMI